MQQLTLKQWKAQGEALYGPNFMDWKFRCPNCGLSLDGEMYRGKADSPERAYSECIGRYDKKQGCDWAAYGLFSTHKEVADSKGGWTHVFDFWDEGKLKGLGLLGLAYDN